MRIAIVTDAWRPQVNGVVRTYEQTIAQLEAMGHTATVISPADFRTFPCPTYPSIRLAWLPRRGVTRALRAFQPDAIHIATEGPLGHAARSVCRANELPFTSAFHTQLPEYIHARVPLPIRWSYAYLRRFHVPAVRTLVPTPSQLERLREYRFEHLVVWPRGVDTTVFRPYGKAALDLPRPISMYMGRVAVEKNLDAFLSLDLPGTRVVVGDGPDRYRLSQQYPDAVFTGEHGGEALARLVSAADVFVFPSLTDTFGVVLLEAMACAVPVAAFPVTGPIDVVEQGVTGVLDADLRKAILGALALSPEPCVAYARSRSWRAATETFVAQLVPISTPLVQRFCSTLEPGT
ncbi:MAG: glycosyltransferase family 1 protein [Gammaproteobacteria bacterium]|nr:glycosyltransferase family 1 protein [Gammaproteobacteria bacterium]